MSRNKIIVGGCSFTDYAMPSKAKPNPMDFKMWPAHIEGYEVINTAKCGSGNRKILSNIIQEVLKHDSEDIAYVIVAWSEWTRQDILTDNSHFTNSPWRTLIPKVDDEKDKLVKEIPHNETFVNEFYKTIQAKYPKDKDIINDQLQMMYLLQCFCNDNNIKLLQFQMLRTFNKFRKESNTTANYDTKETLDPNEYPTDFEMQQRKQREYDFMTNPISLLIDESKFLGFPILKGLGGYTMIDLLYKKYGESYRINGIDAHPNEDAQRFIAEVVLKTLDL